MQLQHKKEAEFDDFNLHLLDGCSQIDSCVIYPARSEVAHCSVSLRRLADDNDVKQINIISLSVCSTTTDDVPKHLKLSLGNMYGIFKPLWLGRTALFMFVFKTTVYPHKKNLKKRNMAQFLCCGLWWANIPLQSIFLYDFCKTSHLHHCVILPFKSQALDLEVCPLNPPCQHFCHPSSGFGHRDVRVRKKHICQTMGFCTNLMIKTWRSAST